MRIVAVAGLHGKTFDQPGGIRLVTLPPARVTATGRDDRAAAARRTARAASAGPPRPRFSSSSAAATCLSS
ncbi:MAG: hypothetical protein R2838_03535 [Caldilineaceae bacterium]